MSDIVLLDSVLDSKKQQYSPDLDDGEVFELFVVDTVLKNDRLSYDELNEGIVDGNKDGGIDAIYLFVNHTLVTEDFDYKVFKGNIEITCYIFQSKNKSSLEESVIDKFRSSLPEFFDLGRNADQLRTRFNDSVVSKALLFRECTAKYAMDFPNVTINISYACRGGEPGDSIKEKADDLKRSIRKRHSANDINFNFYGAKKLYELARSQANISLELPVSGSPLNINNAYAALVTLSDYYQFITSEGQLLDRLFEFNIRDYEGGVAVNREISGSLSDKSDDVDFWWLNNGVTIIAEKARYQNNALVLQNPLIVNGLQTSREIFNALSDEGKDRGKDERRLLIRVIDTENEIVRDRIIKATNSQTKIKPSSLRATEETQKRIEDYLLTKSIYYDRRKNYYKNRGKPAKQIIGIDRLAQCVYSVLICRPDTARGRPASIVKDDDLYRKVFSLGHKFEIYENCFKLHLLVTDYFHANRKKVDAIYRNNLKFHTMMVLPWELSGETKTSEEVLVELDISLITPELIEKVFTWICKLFDEVGPEDKTAKDVAFVEMIFSKWKQNAKK